MDEVEGFADALSGAGFPAMPARVFSALLHHPTGRLTAVELMASLGVSAGGVSGAVNYLEKLGMLRRERTDGQRYDTYVVDEDAWHETTLRTDAAYAPMLAALEQSIAVATPDGPARRRLDVSREFLRFVQAEMAALADRWEVHRQRLG